MTMVIHFYYINTALWTNKDLLHILGGLFLADAYIKRLTIEIY